jgi:glycine/D-amino acid oxidase-like deaminating enzyme
MHSIWEKESFHSGIDVCIVGAGLTGLLTSIFLKRDRPNLKVVVLEKGFSPEGASVKNAGFACFGSVSEILDDISDSSEDVALNRVERRYEGLQKLLEIVDVANIGLQREGGYEMFDSNESGLYQECIKALPYLNQKLQAVFKQDCFYPVSNKMGFNSGNSLIFTPLEASVNSGLLIQALIQKALYLGVEIKFNTLVDGFKPSSACWTIQTGDSELKCSKLVLATNGFTPRILQEEVIVPGRGQILLTEPIKGLELAGNYHLHQGYFYFRNYNGSVLLGGGRHLDRRNEATDSQETSEFIQNHLEHLLREVIIPGKAFQIKQRWAGTMAFGPNNEKEAIVEERARGLFLGVRLGGMGVAMAAQVASELKKLVLA